MRDFCNLTFLCLRGDVPHYFTLYLFVFGSIVIKHNSMQLIVIVINSNNENSATCSSMFFMIFSQRMWHEPWVNFPCAILCLDMSRSFLTNIRFHRKKYIYYSSVMGKSFWYLLSLYLNLSEVSQYVPQSCLPFRNYYASIHFEKHR